MNAERLNAIVTALRKETARAQTPSQINEICNALQQVVNQNNLQFQETLATNLKRIYATLSSASTDNFSPAWKQLLSELGGTGYFGISLKAIIQEIFQRNQITPAVALKELQQLSLRIKEFEKGLEQLAAGFTQFNIGNEQLEPGTCEIGMLIPRDAVKNNLRGFTEELKEITFVLNTFSEVATGKPDDLLIKTISSSDLTVFLHALPRYAACLAFAVERIVALYKQLLEIKKIRGELQKQGVPDAQTAGIAEHANNLMKDGIEKLSVEVIQKYGNAVDPHRKNELENGVRISLNRIANRIDRGYNIEVRVEPLEDVDEESAEVKETREQITIIQSATHNMQFMRLEGEPILKLPESVEKHKAKKE